ARPAGDQFAVVQLVAIQRNGDMRILQHRLGNQRQGKTGMDVILLRHQQEIVADLHDRNFRDAESCRGMDLPGQGTFNDFLDLWLQVVVGQGNTGIFTKHAGAQADFEGIENGFTLACRALVAAVEEVIPDQHVVVIEVERVVGALDDHFLGIELDVALGGLAVGIPDHVKIAFTVGHGDRQLANDLFDGLLAEPFTSVLFAQQQYVGAVDKVLVAGARGGAVGFEVGKAFLRVFEPLVWNRVEATVPECEETVDGGLLAHQLAEFAAWKLEDLCPAAGSDSQQQQQGDKAYASTSKIGCHHAHK